MKINDVKSHQVTEKLSDKNKADIKKVQGTGKGKPIGKPRPLIKMAKMGNKANKANEEDAEKSRDPSDAINKFLKNKKPAARR
jgi:hypothetical protein